MLKRTLISTAIIVTAIILVLAGVHYVKAILFHTLYPMMPAATVLGAVTGILRGLIYNKNIQKLDHQSDRHTIDSFLEHWGTGAGIVVLMVSGFLLKAGLNRILYLNVHFIGLIVTLYFGTYFLAISVITKKLKTLLPNVPDIVDGTIKKYILRSKWNESGKYLSSQKAAFLIFALLGICVFVTGAMKTAAFYFGIPVHLTDATTQAHDLTGDFLVFVLIVHILFSLFVSSHRRLLKSLFTGKF